MARVLILTEEVGEDPCVTSVVAELEKRGAEAVILETRRYPAEMPIVLGDRDFWLGGQNVLAARSLWVRKVEPSLSAEVEHREAALGQASVALWGFLESVPIFQVDPPDMLSGASTKPSVRHLAARLGLEVPRECTTNDAVALRQFARSCPNGVICKLVDSGSISLRRNGQTSSFPTTLMTAEDLEDPVGLEYAPMIFQECVEKILELRLTVVGPEMFVAAVDPGNVLDWRGNEALVRSFRPYEGLPAEIRQKIFCLLDRLGLNFATVDLLLTPDGRHVFLEVNTVSYFDHVERYAGLPVSAAMADLLLGLLAPRVNPGERSYGPS